MLTMSLPAASLVPVSCARNTSARKTLGGTHEGHWCQGGVMVWPGDRGCSRADCSSGSSSQLPVSRRRVGGVLLERPQPRSGEDERAGRRRTAADHGRRGGSFRAGVVKGRSVSPVCGGAEWSHKHPFGGPAVVGGRHDHVFGDRAAQSDDRARLLAGSCRVSELTRGLVTLPVCGCAVVAGFAGGAVSGACAAASRW